MGPFAGVTEVLIPAGYVRTVYDPVFVLSADKKRYVPTNNNTPTTLPAPGLPFSLVFRAEPGKEDIILKVASRTRQLPSAASLRQTLGLCQANHKRSRLKSCETKGRRPVCVVRRITPKRSACWKLVYWFRVAWATFR